MATGGSLHSDGLYVMLGARKHGAMDFEALSSRATPASDKWDETLWASDGLNGTKS